MAISEWEFKTMKLAVAIAILGRKPRDVKCQIFVENMATSWHNRNNHDDKYIRWLELERLQLLHKAALRDAEDSQDSQKSCSPAQPSQIDVNDSCVRFMKSTVSFLQLPPTSVPNYEEVLSVSTDDIVRNIREIIKESELFVDTFSPLLEKCCANFLHVQLSPRSVQNLVGMCELLANFVSTMKTNELCDTKVIDELEEMETESNKTSPNDINIDDINPFATLKPKSENEEIKLLPSPRTQKQVLVNCIVELSRNILLKTSVQQVLVNKILEICESLSAILIARKPGVLDSLYYLIEGLYRTGSISVENIKLIKKCIDLTIVKFPIATRFLLVCSAGKLDDNN